VEIRCGHSAPYWPFFGGPCRGQLIIQISRASGGFLSTRLKGISRDDFSPTHITINRSDHFFHTPSTAVFRIFFCLF
jgi:hypothetical protein